MSGVPETCPQCKTPTKGNTMTTSLGTKACKTCGLKFLPYPLSNPPNLPQF